MMTRKHLRERTGRKVIAAIKKKIVRQSAVFDDSKTLNLVEVFMFGSTSQVLFDSRAIPNVLAESLCFQLHIYPHNTNRRMRMANGCKETVLGKADKIPITMGGMNHPPFFGVQRRGLKSKSRKT